MQVILQEKIKNLGTIGEIVDVKPGYARNYLFSKGKALPANKDNVAKVMAKKSELEKIEKEKLLAAKKRVEGINQIREISISVPTNEEGKLFGSIGSAEVLEVLIEKGVEVSKQEISILEMPVRSVGDYTVVIQPHADVSAELMLKLTSSTASDLNDKKEQDKTSAVSSSEDSTDASTDSLDAESQVDAS